MFATVKNDVAAMRRYFLLLTEGLANQNVAFLETLRPHAFPVDLLAHSQILVWCREAIETGLIDASDPRLAQLQIDMPEPVAATA